MKQSLPVITAFLLGLVLIGAFDFAYTMAGHQSYQTGLWMHADLAWPLSVPLQMALAGVGMFLGWNFISHRLKIEVSGFSKVNFVIALMFTVTALALAFLLAESPLRISLSFLFWFLAVTAIFIAAPRYLWAFLLVGLAGCTVEWLMLRFANCWTFRNQDLFGHLPAWEPLLYGSFGLIIQQLVDWDRSVAR